MHLLIVAKEPRPGLAKTRLIPAYGPEGAAALAAAALADTFAAAAACGARRVVVAFEGDPTGIVPEGFHVVPQRSGSFQERLAGAWEDAWDATGEPGLQIGMDTPQLTADDLDLALDRLAHGASDAVLGLALDGGWWALGLRRPLSTAFDGIPMSTADTGRLQAERLRSLGASPGFLPLLQDVDEPSDVAAVASLAPWTRFAAVAADLDADLGAGQGTQAGAGA